MEHEKSCGAVIFRVGNGIEYLLLHYEAGHWDFVKGHVEKGESEEETVKREILEETGLGSNTFLNDFRERIDYFYRRRGRLVSKEVIFYLVRNTGEEQVKISGEHIGYDWLPYREALDRLTYKNAKETLRKAEEHLQRTELKAVNPPLDAPQSEKEA
jgi:8-oxo-dGTP pyrophosphatase MutT (NUDIX family)